MEKRPGFFRARIVFGADSNYLLAALTSMVFNLPPIFAGEDGQEVSQVRWITPQLSLAAARPLATSTGAIFSLWGHAGAEGAAGRASLVRGWAGISGEYRMGKINLFGETNVLPLTCLQQKNYGGGQAALGVDFFHWVQIKAQKSHQRAWKKVSSADLSEPTKHLDASEILAVVPLLKRLGVYSFALWGSELGFKDALRVLPQRIGFGLDCIRWLDICATCSINDSWRSLCNSSSYNIRIGLAGIFGKKGQYRPNASPYALRLRHALGEPVSSLPKNAVSGVSDLAEANELNLLNDKDLNIQPTRRAFLTDESTICGDDVTSDTSSVEGWFERSDSHCSDQQSARPDQNNPSWDDEIDIVSHAEGDFDATDEASDESGGFLNFKNLKTTHYFPAASSKFKQSPVCLSRSPIDIEHKKTSESSLEGSVVQISDLPSIHAPAVVPRVSRSWQPLFPSVAPGQPTIPSAVQFQPMQKMCPTSVQPGTSSERTLVPKIYRLEEVQPNSVLPKRSAQRYDSQTTTTRVIEAVAEEVAQAEQKNKEILSRGSAPQQALLDGAPGSLPPEKMISSKPINRPSRDSSLNSTTTQHTLKPSPLYKVHVERQISEWNQGGEQGNYMSSVARRGSSQDTLPLKPTPIRAAVLREESVFAGCMSLGCSQAQPRYLTYKSGDQRSKRLRPAQGWC